MSGIERPVFDPGKLLHNAMEDKMLARKLLHLFLSDLPQRVTAIRGAATEGNTSLLRQQAHALKGASFVVGAERLAHWTQGLEHACRKGAATVNVGVLPDLDGLAMATRQHMQDWLGNQAVGGLP
jgi:HPt (histidine-containing phosphotransfer) domain-containing protein